MIRTPNTIRPVALVMSATIAPPPRAPELARSNPSLRLSDYCDALRFYLSLPDDVLHKVLFIDNSNYDLSALEAIANEVPHRKQVEFITFQGNDHPPEFGKGYGEFKLIDYGMAHSSIIGAEDFVWKVTGYIRFSCLDD